MPLNFGTGFFSGLGGAAEDLFSSKGATAEAKAYTTASGYSTKNAALAEQSAALQSLQAQREILKTIGGQQADVAGAGFQASGSALDLLKSSTAEGEITKQLIRTQGQINKTGYQAEATAYTGQATAAKAAGNGKKASMVGNLIGAGLALFGLSDRRLKEDVSFVRRRSDGLAIYRFRYLGLPELWEGVMADEVEDLYPNAVDRFGEEEYMRVDYEMIGERCILVQEA